MASGIYNSVNNRVALTYDATEYNTAYATYNGATLRVHRPWGIDGVGPDRAPRYLSDPVPEG